MAVADLSYAQQGVWLADQLAGDSAVYNVSLNLRLHGSLDRVRLRRAMAALAARHETLRTAVMQIGGRPQQFIADSLEPPWSYSDLSGRPETELKELVDTEARQRFALDRAPLYRVRLVRLAAEHHLLAICFHHIIVDAWSLDVLLDDLASIYISDDTLAAAVARPTLRYADYAMAERAADVEDRLAFWRRTLAGSSPSCFPTDRTPPLARTFHGARHEFAIPDRVLAAVRELARRGRTTLFVAALTSFTILLMRYCGRSDLLVGVPVSGRLRPEAEPETDTAVGLFVDTLPLRLDLSGNPTVVQLLNRVRSVWVQAMANYCPLERIAESGGLDQLCRTVLGLHRAAGARRLGDVRMTTDWQPDPGAAKFDLALYLVEDDGSPRGIFEYRTDLYEATTVQRLADNLILLMSAAASAADVPVGLLPLLDVAEREWLQARSGAPARPTRSDHGPDAGPPADTVVSLITASVGRSPSATAVWAGGFPLAYADLDRRSRSLAQRLARFGPPGQVIGVCLPRTVDLVVAMVGILRSGNAYLPLDPDYPIRRLEYMLTDAGTDVVVTSRHLGTLLFSGLSDQKIIRLDEPDTTGTDASVNRGSAVPTSSGPQPQGVAYVMYTSGSTGEPKGVAVNHEQLLASTQARGRLYGASPDVFLSLSSVSFDSFVAGLYWTLCGGGTFVMPDSGDMRDPHRIADLVERMGVTHVLLLPSLYSVCVDILAARGASLRVVTCAGEELRPETVRQHRAARPDVLLYNEYGPTEGVVWATGCRVDADTPPIPLGQARDGVHVYVLDRELELAPIGVAGEVYLGGPGVGVGYHRRPGPTADRFVPDLFAVGGRLYRTGDLARWRSGGDLEYLGRGDEQVSLRGYRIEPGEVETVLQAHPQVRQAVVGVHGVDAAATLAAHLVARGPMPIDVADVVDFAGQRLPRHMVPSRFLIVDRIPTTPNGKIDRQAVRTLDVPAPVVEVGRGGRRFVAPHDGRERLLANIFADVLQVEVLGAEDDFFSLGGNSLAAMAIAVAAGRAGLEIRVIDVMAARSVRDLAARTPTGEAGPARRSVPTGEPLSLTPVQEGMWLEDQLSTSPGASNLACAVLLEGPLDRGRLAASWRFVIRRNAVLRLRVDVDHGRLRQRLLDPDTLVTELVEVAATDDLTHQVEQLRRRPLDLAEGPAHAGYLIPLDGGRSVLVVVIHHIFADLVTQQEVLRQLADAYNTSSMDAGGPDPAEGIGEFGHYLVESAEQRGPSPEVVSFWREVVRRAGPVLPVRPGPAASTAAAWLERPLPTPVLSRMSRVARRVGTSQSVVALAAFASALCAATGRSRVTVGMPISTRDRPAYERAVGPFLEMLVVPLELPAAGQTFEQLVRLVSGQFQSCYQNRIPFQDLMALARPAKRGRAAALIDAVFNYLGQPLSPPVLTGLTATLVPVPMSVVPFPLEVYWKQDGSEAVAHVVWQRENLSREWVSSLLDLFLNPGGDHDGP